MAPTWTAGEYDALLRDLILGHKERQQFGLRTLLGQLLAGAISGLAEEAGLGAAPPLFLVPVPSQPASVRARGHDPTLELVRAAQRDLAGATRVVRLLQVSRILDQSGLTHDQRAANLAGSMRVVPRRLRRLTGARPVRGWAVVCDDVLTTGATAREAQRALAFAGFEVLGIATVAATRLRSSGGVSGNLHGTSLAKRPPTD